MNVPKRVGFIGGKFSPIHNGHVYAMTVASCMVDELHVIVCYDEESEKKELHDNSKIPYIHHTQRARWWKEITKHLPHVHVHMVYNKNTMKIADWQQGATDIKKVIGKPITHVFSSEESYTAFFNELYPEAQHIVVDGQKERFPISSSRLRAEGVYEHWDMLPGVVQRYFIKKVVVVGSESCGKSTLVQNLALLYNTNFVEEHGRSYYEEIGDFDTFYQEDFNKIAYRQKYFEEVKLKHANKVLFCDTEALVTNRFHKEFFGTDSDLLREIACEQQYDLWLFLQDDVPFIDDGTRGYVNDQHYSTQLLKDSLDEHRIPYVIVKGSYEERLLIAMEKVDELLE